MKKSALLISGILLCSQFVLAQGKYFTRSGTLTFFSKTTMENIEAKNNQSSCIFDTETGEIAISALMKGFEFEKALMQEHFNENYVESHKYPKATFKGIIKDYASISISDNTPVNVIVVGTLTVHGVDKEIETASTLTKKGDNYEALSKFNVSADDFDIKIPKAVVNNIAKEIEVTANLQLEPYVQ